MLPSKFGVNWPFGSGEEAKNRFSRWRPWRPSWISDRNDFSYLWSTSHPDASYQVSSQLAQGCRRSRLLKQLLTPHDGRRTTHDGHWLTTIAHHEHFVLRWANKKKKRKKKKKHFHVCKQCRQLMKSDPYLHYLLQTSYQVPVLSRQWWGRLTRLHRCRLAWSDMKKCQFLCFSPEAFSRPSQSIVPIVPTIAPDIVIFQPKSIDIFLISSWKHMLCVLIRSASARRF